MRPEHYQQFLISSGSFPSRMKSLGLIMAALYAGFALGQTPQTATPPSELGKFELPTQAEEAKDGGQGGKRIEGEKTGRPAWLITPAVSVDMTSTDNVLMRPNKRSDFVTKIGPSLKVNGKSARLEGNVNLQWHKYYYASDSAEEIVEKSIAANGKLELVEQWLFLDASHNTSKRPSSVFSAPGAKNIPSNPATSSETTSTMVSPYIQGHFGGFADYQLRYNATQSGAATATGTLSPNKNVTSSGWNARVSGDTPLALIGWTLTSEQTAVSQLSGLETRTSRDLAHLNLRIDPQVRLTLSFGQESDNFSAFGERNKPSRGWKVEWAPTERTQVLVSKDRRAYGDMHHYSFTHRTGLTAWKISDSKDARITPPTLSQNPTGTIYDLLFLQLASQFPDPIERAKEVEKQLMTNGLSADAPVNTQILTTQAFSSRRQQASVSYTGTNNTVVLAVDRSTSSSFFAQSGNLFNDDFAQSNSIRQQGFNTSWAYRLSPVSSLTFNGARSKTQGAANQSTQMQSLSVTLTTSLGEKSRAAVGLRKAKFESNLNNSYDETAVTGSLMHTF